MGLAAFPGYAHKKKDMFKSLTPWLKEQKERNDFSLTELNININTLEIFPTHLFIQVWDN